MTNEKKSSASDARSVLIEWANRQDNWIKNLVSEIRTTRKESSVDRSKEHYLNFLIEKDLSKGTAIEVAPLVMSQQATTEGEGLRIISISEVEGVNALASGQQIAFNPSLTLIFGENGAGKTGYSRILKLIASARSAEEILHDVRPAGKRSDPKAKIAYAVGQNTNAVEWKGERGVFPFTDVDVFDSRFARVHVEDDLTYAYTPGELAVFPAVQATIDSVKKMLEADIVVIDKLSHQFLDRIDRQTLVYRKMEALGASTDFAEIEKLSQVNSSEVDRIPVLESEIDALKSNSPEAQVRVLQTEAALLAEIGVAVKAMSAFDPSSYNQAVRNFVSAKRQQLEVGKNAFAKEGIPQVLTDAWTSFVSAGEEYRKSLDGRERDKNDTCLYCRQNLSETAISLIEKYRRFVEDGTSLAIASASQESKRVSSHIVSLSFEPLLKKISDRLVTKQFDALPHDLFLKTEKLFILAADLKGKLEKQDEVDSARWNGDCADILALIDESNKKLKEASNVLSARSGEREAELKKRTEELHDIRARTWLQKALPQVEDFVVKKKWADKAKLQLSRFRTISRSFTEASKEACEELLNKDFEAYFDEECQHLVCPKVGLHFPGRNGQVSRKKSIGEKFSPEDILSEGEQKVIALADFLAESRLRSAASPVVFDDPVNSLDYKRLGFVVRRIVNISRTRQTIVFTHNILFATQILAAFEDDTDKCSYFDVEASEQTIGVVTKGTHPRADTFKYLRGKINKVINESGPLQGEVKSAMIEKGYEYLRSICEVIVEKELFKDVIDRFRPNVRITVLKDIRYERLKAATEVVAPIFDKACRYIASHSQPLETLATRPTLEDLKRDWAEISAALESYKAA